jgi:hypothetical protein
MNRRRAAVDKQLQDLHLCSRDVKGDGNCLFRSACICAYGDEEQHIDLRMRAADYARQNRDNLRCTFSLTNEQFDELVSDLATPNTSVGELAVYILPNILSRQLVVHIADVEPQAYSSSSGSHVHQPVQVAFFDGLLAGTGHYKAVLPSFL